ncbi:AraC family transcriptional regulator [Ottowia thiooxydans]|uniref:AraC-like DNA-binding protein n=1 Tax=Ottowia thiooxydans TaxID=219182 RepID=A0ABV2Q3Q4_9BURK
MDRRIHAMPLAHAARQRLFADQSLLVADPMAFAPSSQHPVRTRPRNLPAEWHFERHHHAWAQLAYCTDGLLQVVLGSDAQLSFIVPPSRAILIPPNEPHAITALQAARMHTLYIDGAALPQDWTTPRVLAVSGLFRELALALDDSNLSIAREGLLSQLVLDELQRADLQTLGVPLPRISDGDKRLSALCEAVMRNPAKRATLADWAKSVGASERTAARLFHEELGTSYQQWRQQVVLAHALPLLANGIPVGQVATRCGYASESAFSAMFKGTLGQSPRAFSRMQAKRNG